MINNPILPGFNPDPSFCRVADDYYIATSTFQWYPGVQIHHSKDLANWTLLSRPLNRASQLDMRGNPDDCGVWAPCLSYANDQFWLVYTDVKRHAGDFKDAHNYIVTCSRIDGEWSNPTYVNSSGFDPSLFHDDDGRKYFLNMRWNHLWQGSGCNSTHDAFDGILLQEWSVEKGLFGPVKNIYSGTERGLTEAPHLFKRNGYYYLTTAEGGTSYDHAVSLARSKNLWGPYENHPNHHVISTRDKPDHPLQRTGHGQYVEAADGSAWHTFLMGRPIAGNQVRNCPLGRETGLAPCVWKEDWLYLQTNDLLPAESFDGPQTLSKSGEIHESFDSLPSSFQWLRTPYPNRLFRIEQGKLILIGRESMGSWFEQSLVARRQEDLFYSAETTVEFSPNTYQQAAGLTTYYDRHRFHAALITHFNNARVLILMSCNSNWPDGHLEFPLDEPVVIPDGPIQLSVQVNSAKQQFYWSAEGCSPQPLGPERDAYLISDEGGRTPEHSSFTGAFVGMVAYDITGSAAEASFTRFSYLPSTRPGD